MSDFWEATAIRAAKTVCQTAVATIGTAMVITDVDWKVVISASILSGILSVLTSIATGLPEVELAEVIDTEEEDDADLDEEEDDEDDME